MKQITEIKDKDGNVVRRKVTTVNNQPSMTKQSFKKECDINNIMAKHAKTGLINHVNQFDGKYGDATSIDYHEAMNIVTSSQQMFEALPAETRNRFANDPAQFLDFVQNPDNAQEMVSMGLATSSAQAEVAFDDAAKAATGAAPEAQTAPENASGMS